MHLAYIISAYKYPEQLIRLIHRLNTGATSFFVHVDKKTDDQIYREIFDAFSDQINVHFVKRHRCDWGGFGHVAATLEGIGAIFRTNTRFEYAILLTGQDYPIKSTHDIDAFFEAHKGKLFLEFFHLPTDVWQNRGLVGGMERIEAWHWRIFRRHIRFWPGRLFLLRRKFPAGFKPFGGSSYWCLSRECIEYIYDLTALNPAFVRFFNYVDVPDEIFFQTAILNSRFKESVVNDNLRYIDWKDGNSGSPRILRQDDFSTLFCSRKLFARKFDMTIDASVLNMIDEKILNKSCSVE
jgi:Core-2/I-Branching enzyme